MWPFSRWRSARQRAFIRDVFGQFIRPDLVDYLASRPVDPSLEKRRVLFVLLQLRDDVATSLGERLKLAIDVAGDGQGMLDFIPPFLFVGFGYPLNDRPEDLRSQRQRTVERLLNECGRDVRIVYGESECLVGLLGSERRFSYGALIPRFSTAMQRLLALEFGAASEVTL